MSDITRMDLAEFGWNDRLAAALAALGQPEWRPGRVVSEHRGVRLLLTSEGEIAATVAGRLEHHAASAAELPHIGDWVSYAPVPGESKGVIHQVLPRTSRLSRKIPGRANEEQILAANVDLAFIVQALDNTFRIRRIERFLSLALDSGIRPVLILNKADLNPDHAPLVAAAEAVAAGATVIVTSAETRKGLKALARLIQPADTVVFLGSSGVGKSSLINRLCRDELQATIEVRERDSKGRHTTTAREILPLPGGGLVIDTPGLREVQLWIQENTLDEAFGEIHGFGAQCRFRDCRHENEPGCAVRAALEAGTLTRERYDSFLKLRREQESVSAGISVRARQERQRQIKVIHRSLNRFQRHQADDE